LSRGGAIPAELKDGRMPMLRISSAIVVAMLTLAGTTTISVPAALAQGNPARGGSAMEKCVAACQHSSVRQCDKFCERKAANRQ
jgi:hypothetical protein